MKKLILSAIFAATAITGSAASATQYWVQDGIKLNARTGPSTYYQSVGKFNGCTKLHVVAYQKGWAKVAWNHNYYWVASNYLQNHGCYKNNHHKSQYNTHKSYGY